MGIGVEGLIEGDVGKCIWGKAVEKEGIRQGLLILRFEQESQDNGNHVHRGEKPSISPINRTTFTRTFHTR
jgi:hypothetical protein